MSRPIYAHSRYVTSQLSPNALYPERFTGSSVDRVGCKMRSQLITVFLATLLLLGTSRAQDNDNDGLEDDLDVDDDNDGVIDAGN